MRGLAHKPGNLSPWVKKECGRTRTCIFANCCPVLLRVATLVRIHICYSVVSVRLSVTHQYCIEMDGRRCTLADTPVHSSFLVLNVLMKFEWVAFSGVRNGGAVDKIGDFRPISRHLSETVQHRNSFYWPLIGSHMWPIDWHHFLWPSMTHNHHEPSYLVNFGHFPTF